MRETEREREKASTRQDDVHFSSLLNWIQIWQNAKIPIAIFPIHFVVVHLSKENLPTSLHTSPCLISLLQQTLNCNTQFIWCYTRTHTQSTNHNNYYFFCWFFLFPFNGLLNRNRIDFQLRMFCQLLTTRFFKLRTQNISIKIKKYIKLLLRKCWRARWNQKKKILLYEYVLALFSSFLSISCFVVGILCCMCVVSAGCLRLPYTRIAVCTRVSVCII